MITIRGDVSFVRSIAFFQIIWFISKEKKILFFILFFLLKNFIFQLSNSEILEEAGSDLFENCEF